MKKHLILLAFFCLNSICFGQKFFKLNWSNENERTSAIITYFSESEIYINQSNTYIQNSYLPTSREKYFLKPYSKVQYQGIGKIVNNKLIIQGIVESLSYGKRRDGKNITTPLESYSGGEVYTNPKPDLIVNNFWIDLDNFTSERILTQNYKSTSSNKSKKSKASFQALKFGSVHPKDLIDYFKEESYEYQLLKNPKIETRTFSSTISVGGLFDGETGEIIKGTYLLNKNKIELPITELKNSTLHCIILANTKDKKLSRPIFNDIGVFNSFLSSASDALRLKYKQYLLKDNDFNLKKIEFLLGNLKIENNDLIVFLYRGHGFRWADQKSDYPRIDLTINGNSNKDYNSLNIEEDIYNKLLDKNPRFLLVIGDTCNSQDGITPVENEYTGLLYEQNQPSAFATEKLAKLLSEKSKILAVSAKPGDKSYATKTGGLFTESFIEKLTSYTSPVSGKNGSWEELIQESFKSARVKSKNLKRPPQNGIIKSNN